MFTNSNEDLVAINAWGSSVPEHCTYDERASAKSGTTMRSASNNGLESCPHARHALTRRKWQLFIVSSNGNTYKGAGDGR